MELDRLSLALRERAPWEAIDLGVELVRRWGGVVYGSWLVVYLPVVALVLVLVPSPWWALLVLWWIKPLFDRIPLWILSRAIFGAAPTVATTVREVPRLLGRDLLGALVLRRLDACRRYVLPLAELEGLSGPAYRKRRRLLVARQGRQAIQLLIVLHLVQGALASSCLSVAWLLLPQGVGDAGEWMVGFMEPRTWDAYGYLFVGPWIAAGLILGPLHVAAGFALYLNRRVGLEAWDVEIAFRRLGRRLISQRAPRRPVDGAMSIGLLVATVLLGTVLLGTVLLGAMLLSTMRASHAADEPRPRDVIRSVLEHEDFDRTRVARQWVPKGSSGTAVIPLEIGAWIRWVALGAILAAMGIILWYAVRRARMEDGGSETSTDDEGAIGETRFDLRRELMPDDVPETVREWWSRGDRLEALGLLFRGCLIRLIDERGLVIERSDTEGDCRRRVGTLGERELTSYFRDLVRAWQSLAYGGIAPDDATIERLCDRWPGVGREVSR